MVFLLRHILHGEILILGHNQNYTLGRSRRNAIHLTDETVNRRHALIETTNVEAAVEDQHSNYGTWVNKQKLTEPYRLKNGDVILFGKASCKYVFLEPKFEVQIDTNIPNPTKYMLAETLRELNISLAKNYARTNTHYIVDSVSLDTLKEQTILNYLIDRKTVITSKYFVNILANIKEVPLMPNIYKYMPEIDNHLQNKGVDDIEPRKNRRHIFDDTAFIFFDKAYEEEFTDLIIKCGGESYLHSEKFTFFKQLFEDTDGYQYIMVNHNPVNKRSPEMCNFLKHMKRSRQPLQQISTDDLYVSIMKGKLMGCNEGREAPECPKEPEPGPSKSTVSIVVDSSESDQSDAESDRVDIVCQLVNQKKLRPIRAFNTLAAAYKKQKTLQETVLQNHASASTLNRWISRNNGLGNLDINQDSFERSSKRLANSSKNRDPVSGKPKSLQESSRKRLTEKNVSNTENTSGRNELSKRSRVHKSGGERQETTREEPLTDIQTDDESENLEAIHNFIENTSNKVSKAPSKSGNENERAPSNRDLLTDLLTEDENVTSTTHSNSPEEHNTVNQNEKKSSDEIAVRTVSNHIRKDPRVIVRQSSLVTVRKGTTSKKMVQNDKESFVDDDSSDGGFNGDRIERSPQPANGKGNMFVKNPFAIRNNLKQAKAKINSRTSNLDHWQRKYKNIEIVPVEKE